MRVVRHWSTVCTLKENKQTGSIYAEEKKKLQAGKQDSCGKESGDMSCPSHLSPGPQALGESSGLHHSSVSVTLRKTFRHGVLTQPALGHLPYGTWQIPTTQPECFKLSHRCWEKSMKNTEQWTGSISWNSGNGELSTSRSITRGIWDLFSSWSFYLRKQRRDVI